MKTKNLVLKELIVISDGMIFTIFGIFVSMVRALTHFAIALDGIVS